MGGWESATKPWPPWRRHRRWCARWAWYLLRAWPARRSANDPPEALVMLEGVRTIGRATLLFALCLLVDLADPFTPGAWSFDPQQSIAAHSAAHRTMPVLN